MIMQYLGIFFCYTSGLWIVFSIVLFFYSAKKIIDLFGGIFDAYKYGIGYVDEYEEIPKKILARYNFICIIFAFFPILMLGLYDQIC